ncbi:lanthionine synthetase LanC family protein [Streptomyces marokkonensis]|uniref:Lanthionine synthetase LanC family protein n=1 Tax=Streptomyces marokkonensis TaxID=324855 RepID=A0ABW6Q2E4_9ACTN
MAHGVAGPLALAPPRRLRRHRPGRRPGRRHHPPHHLGAALRRQRHRLARVPASDRLPGRARGAAAPYGTPGIARALQLAALTLHDHAARRLAEHTALQAITDPRQTGQITETSLCHGWAGLLLTADRIASDAALPDLAEALPALHNRLTTEMGRRRTAEHAGLLTGNAGVLLTLHTLTTARPVDLGWETCLLLNRKRCDSEPDPHGRRAP